MRRPKTWMAPGLLALLVGCSGAVKDYAVQPTSRTDFTNRFQDVRPPITASNFFYASSGVGPGGRAFLYRFEAPPADCLNYARLLAVPDAKPDVSEQGTATNLVTLTRPPEPISKAMLQAYGLSRVSWFDIERIKSGFTGRAAPGNLASIWVDTGRGRFYYYWTD